ncbi:MAG TPA: hypothetical protein VFQ20_04840 [Burkholderiaceae bacterium]|nr:hypothetical protein [Burkholderiaceae bacterium]
MTVTRIAIGCGLAAPAVALAALIALSPYRYIGIGVGDAAPAAAPRAARVPPLLGADGTPQPALPQAVPADPRERTHAALYATRAQAHALEADLDGAVIWIDAGCCDERAVTFALELAESARTGKHLALDAPVFITGADLKLAALVVNRLADDGHTLVFLVTR